MTTETNTHIPDGSPEALALEIMERWERDTSQARNAKLIVVIRDAIRKAQERGRQEEREAILLIVEDYCEERFPDTAQGRILEQIRKRQACPLTAG